MAAFLTVWGGQTEREAAFLNVKLLAACLAILVAIGGIFAFDDYKISEADDFIKRTDSVAIPRNILYGPDVTPAGKETPGSGEPVRGGATADMPQVEDDTTNGVETTQPAVEPGETIIAEEAAKAYYSNTVFEVVSLELKSQTENEIIFSVCVSKGGEVQEPNRTITLQLNNGTWEIINEGY